MFLDDYQHKGRLPLLFASGIWVLWLKKPNKNFTCILHEPKSFYFLRQVGKFGNYGLNSSLTCQNGFLLDNIENK